MINFLRRYIAILFVFLVIIFTGPTGFAAPTLGSSGAGGGGSLGALPSCFEGSVYRPLSSPTNVGTSINDTGDPWVVMTAINANTSESPSPAEFAAKFTRTSNDLEFTSLDAQAIRLNVDFSIPFASSGSGNMEMAVTYGACALDYAVSGDPKVGLVRTNIESTRFLGGVGSTTFDLPALGCWAIITRSTTGSSSSHTTKAWSVNVRQVSTPARPCT